jgi:hypothetical protein
LRSFKLIPPRPHAILMNCSRNECLLHQALNVSSDCKSALPREFLISKIGDQDEAAFSNAYPSAVTLVEESFSDILQAAPAQEILGNTCVVYHALVSRFQDLID